MPTAIVNTPDQPHTEPQAFWQSLWPSPEAVTIAGRHSSESMELLIEYVTLMLHGGSVVCIDENDVRDVLAKPGRANLGIGEASGEMRVTEATQRAITDFLADNICHTVGIAALVMVAGSTRMRLQEILAVLNLVHKHFGSEDVLVGCVFDDELGETLRVYLIGVIGE